MLGYVSQISAPELKDSNFAGLKAGATVGQAGVEYTLRHQLRGTDGLLEQNYDAAGRAVGQTYVQRAAQPGDTLQLTIDYRLQKIAQQAIAYGIQVAHNDGETTAHTGAHRRDEPAERRDPSDGVVSQLRPLGVPAAGQGRRAAVPRQVQPAAGRQDARAEGAGLDVQADHRHRGLERRASWAGHAARVPGRLLPARATRRTRRSPTGRRRRSARSTCRPRWRISCNTFFFQLGNKILQPQPRASSSRSDPQLRIRQAAAAGHAGVAVLLGGWCPTRPGGCRPTRRRSTRSGSRATTSTMAIGQGDLTVSPMQLAVAYSAIANGGKLVTPHVGKALHRQPGPRRKRFDPKPQRILNLSPTLLSEIRQGLYQASHSARRHVHARCSAPSSPQWRARPAPPSTRRIRARTPGMRRCAPCRQPEAGRGGADQRRRPRRHVGGAGGAAGVPVPTSITPRSCSMSSARTSPADA